LKSVNGSSFPATKVLFGEERVLKIKVHPDFNKFSEKVILDIIFGGVFFSQVPKENALSFPFRKIEIPKSFPFRFTIIGKILRFGAYE